MSAVLSEELIGEQATRLAVDVTACQALIAGLPVARERLKADVLASMGEPLEGEPLVLTDELALRVEATRPVRPELRAENGHSTPSPVGARSSTQRFEAVPFSSIERGQVEWLDPGRVPIGGVTVLFGDPGLGKSQWTCLLAARLSRGELGDPGATLLFTAEDDSSRTIRPRLEAAAADLELVHCVRATGDDGFTLPDEAGELNRLIEEKGARLAIIDPIAAHLEAGLNSWRDSEVRRALRPLADAAERQGCAVVIVMHMNKSNGVQAIYRAGGSIGFMGAARSSLLLARDPDDPDGEAGCRRALSHVKSNLSAEAPTLIYDVEPILLPARGLEPESETSRLTLIGESDRRSRDLLAFDGEERSALEEAMDFLRDELASGPKLRADVLKAARKEGVAEKTLRRARESLGVSVDRVGYPAKSWWSLSRAQAGWARLETPTLGHDWTNPHGQRDSGLSEGASGPSRAQSQILGTTGLEEAEITFLDECQQLVDEGAARWVS